MIRRCLRGVYLGVRAGLLAPLGALRRRAVPPADCRKILVVRLDRVGDVVLSTPFLRNLRARFPVAGIVLVAQDFARDVVPPGLVDRIATPPAPGDRARLDSLTAEGFDLGFDMHYDYTLASARLLRRIGARCTVGFNIGGRGALFEIPVPARDRKHFIQETFDLLRAVGVEPRPVPPEVAVWPDAEGEAAEALRRQGVHGPYVTFHPGGFYAAQRWPADRFAQLADLTASLGWAPIFIGGGQDGALIAEVAAHMRRPPAVVCAHRLAVSTAVIARSNLFVGNNSGPLHIATALGVPSVSTMGPTDPIRFWPVSERAVVLRAARVDGISLSAMMDAVTRFLAPAATRQGDVEGRCFERE